LFFLFLFIILSCSSLSGKLRAIINQECTIQRNWKHWIHKTQDEDKQNKTTLTQSLPPTGHPPCYSYIQYFVCYKILFHWYCVVYPDCHCLYCLISTFLLLSLGWYHCWWNISPRWYHPVSSRWFISYIYYWNLQFINKVIIIKYMVLLSRRSIPNVLY
jgi:hypothetical protein